MTAGPIIKWVGGKSRLLPELLLRAPKAFNRYYEPFVGGGALFFALAPKHAVLGDMNEALIDMYQTLVFDVEGVIACLRQHKRQHTEDHYYEVRTWWNEERSKCIDGVSVAAAFIYLNKTCFNGLWRVNKSGEFNVPMGDYKDPAIYDPDALRAAVNVLEKATLMVNEFDITAGNAKAGDFVYFDPPYVPISITSSFTSYTTGVFGEKQQVALANHARDLVDKGVHVMLSNNDVPLVHELYKGFHIDVVQRAGTVSSKGSKRGKVNEVIITDGGN